MSFKFFLLFYLPCNKVDFCFLQGTVKRVSLYYAVQHLWSDFTDAFTNTYVVKWVVWWALSTCGYWQVISYIQLLWQTVRKDNQDDEPPLYGIVEAAYTLLGKLIKSIKIYQ